MSEQNQSETEKLAGEIVEELFTDGADGKQATRLVLQRQLGLPGSGWGKVGVTKVIQRILEANPQPRLAMTREQLERVAQNVAERTGMSTVRSRKAILINAFLPYIEQPQSFGDEIISAMEWFTDEVEQSEPSKPLVPKPGDRVRIVDAEKMGPTKEFSSGPIYDHKLVAGQTQTVYSVHGKRNEKFAGCFSVSETSVWFPPEYIAEILPAEPQEDERENGELCQCCGDRYLTIYRVPNEVWKQIAPDPEAIGDDPGHYGGLLCPDCADSKAREAGIVLHWEAFEGDWHCCEEPPKPASDCLEVENVRGEWNKLRSYETPETFTDSLKKFAQHFQNRGFELGRAAGDAENQSLKRLKEMNIEIKKNLAEQIETLTAELAAAKEEVEQQKFYKEQYLHLFETLNKSIGKQAPIQTVPGPPSKEALGDDDKIVYRRDFWPEGRWDIASGSYFKGFGLNATEMINVQYHINLGPITPPQQEPELPVCKHCKCNLTEHYLTDWYWLSCKICNWSSEKVNGRYREQAIEAARAAGENK